MQQNTGVTMSAKNRRNAKQHAVSDESITVNKAALANAFMAANRSALGRIDPRISMFSEYGPSTKHSREYDDYGYQHNLTFQDFYFLYERFGLAAAVVDFPGCRDVERDSAYYRQFVFSRTYSMGKQVEPVATQNCILASCA